MKKTVLTFIRLFIGLFLCAVGIVMTINANLGLAPWDVFHQGIANIFNITIGKANIIIGIIIVIAESLSGERLGWGTLCNMLFVGIFIDVLMLNNLVPTFDRVIPSIIMILLGMLIIGFGCYLYIGAGLGAGPRDNMMVIFTKKTNKSVRLVKCSIELVVLIIGYILGGKVGIGTVIMAIGGGYFTQLAFKIAKFDVSKVEQRIIADDVSFIKDKLLATK